MQNKNGMELAISTLIVIALGVLVLAAIAFMLTDGFKNFKSSTKPVMDTAESVAIREACSLSCTAKDSYGYCCRKQKLDGQNITCEDQRLGIECDFSCENVKCTG